MVESDVHVLKGFPPKLHTSISVYFYLRTTHQGSQSHSRPIPLSHAHAQPHHAAQGQDCNHSCTSGHGRAPLLSSLSSLSLWVFFHFRLANRGDTIWWCDVYALSGWSLFTCQSIRASYCGRSDSHEASARKWTHDSHNTNSTCALSSPYLCTINF